MINKNNKSKLITFSPRTLDMMEAIMFQTGFKTASQIVTRGVEELYKSTFKYGTDPLSGGSITGNSDSDYEKQAERKAKQKQLLKNAEEKERLLPKINICKRDLKGIIEINELGTKSCRFTQYRHDGNDQECVVPLQQVEPYIVETSLFMPSKKAVLNKRPELKEIS